MNRQHLFRQTTVGVGIGIALLFGFGKIVAMPTLSAFAGGVVDEAPEPAVAIERTELDLGEVRPGTVAQATFELRNVGGSRLILRRTNGDCDCGSAAAATIIVEPGQRRTVVAEMDITQVLGPAKIGVHYQTNDPKRPRLTLSGLANVTAE